MVVAERGRVRPQRAGAFAVSVYLDELRAAARPDPRVEERLRQATTGDSLVGALLAIRAWTMRALIGRFDRFVSGKQLARFCAVTPRNASSGQRVADSGMIRAGDPHSRPWWSRRRSACVGTTRAGVSSRRRWAARGKPTSVIVGAIANRWLRGLYHAMKELPMAA